MKLVHNLVSMLKPGGWIQWSEWDIGTRNLIKVRPDVPSEAMEKVDDMLANVKEASKLARWEHSPFRLGACNTDDIPAIAGRLNWNPTSCKAACKTLLLKSTNNP